MQNHPRLAPFMPGGRLFAELCSESEPVNFYVYVDLTSWEKVSYSSYYFFIKTRYY